jgi:S1-C subfamily serine protease
MLSHYFTPELAKWRAAEFLAEADHERLVRQSRRKDAHANTRRSARAVSGASRARRGRLLLRLAGTATLLLLLLAFIPNIARADEPSAASRAVVLGEPGVVFIRTSVAVRVRLTYADASSLSGVDAIDGDYKIDYASGSGFVVSPDGTMVTASHVVEPDKQDLRNYATNQLLLELNGADPWQQYEIPDDPVMDRLLGQCYRAIACKFSSKPIIEVFTPVQLAGTRVSKGLSARVLRSTGYEATDVAVLRVDGANMPTVPLADSVNRLQSGDELVALGFPGSAQELPSGVTEPTRAFGRVSNVRSVGSSREVQADVRIEGGMSGGPVLDGEGQLIGLTSSTGLSSRGERTQAYLRTVDDIRSALADAGVQPTRGQVDALFAQAMSNFWQGHYSVSLPLFQQVENLYDGHPLAKRFLAEAQAKAGTAEDIPLRQPKKTAPIAPIALVLLVAVVVAGLIRSRRHHQQPTTVTRSAPLDTDGTNTDLGADATTPSQAEPLVPVGFQSPTTPAASAAKQKQQFCTACGGALGAASRFCGYCGHQAA